MGEQRFDHDAHRCAVGGKVLLFELLLVFVN